MRTMNILLGGILTNDEVYSSFKNDFIIETYQNINFDKITHYTEIINPIYEKHFKNKLYDMIIGHSMGGILLISLLLLGYQINANSIIICESYLSEPSFKFRNIVYQNNLLENRLNEIMQKESKRYNQDIFSSLRKLDIRESINSIKQSLLFIYGMREMDEPSFRAELSFPVNNHFLIQGIPKTSHFCLIEESDFFIQTISKYHFNNLK